MKVIFWTAANEAITFGTTSKFYFNTEEEAMAFVEAIEVPNCHHVTIDNNDYLIVD